LISLFEPQDVRSQSLAHEAQKCVWVMKWDSRGGLGVIYYSSAPIFLLSNHRDTMRCTH